MDYTDLPQGAGQEIYIDPEALYIRSEWINNELHAIFLPEIANSINNPIYEFYRKMFMYFYENGYKVITDSREVSKDTFFFIACENKRVYHTKEEYQKSKENKLFSYLLNAGIKPPRTICFPEESFPDVELPLPFVLKNEAAQGGQEKFLIETPRQLETLKRFYNEIDSLDRKIRIDRVKMFWSCYDDLTFDENGHSQRGISVGFIDYKKEFHRNMRIQEYVKTPTKYNTSLRVLTSSSGDILCSSLKYSLQSNLVQDRFYGLFDKYLSDPFSRYFLNSACIVSNTVAGGSSILLGMDNYNELEKEILMAHGINPENASLPDTVMKACMEVAEANIPEIGAICGMDFIYDAETCEWKYLEEHEYPMLISYAQKYGFPYDPQSENFYITHQLLDIRVRLQSLSLTMKKKQQVSSKQIKL